MINKTPVDLQDRFFFPFYLADRRICEKNETSQPIRVVLQCNGSACSTSHLMVRRAKILNYAKAKNIQKIFPHQLIWYLQKSQWHICLRSSNKYWTWNLCNTKKSPWSPRNIKFSVKQIDSACATTATALHRAALSSLSTEIRKMCSICCIIVNLKRKSITVIPELCSLSWHKTDKCSLKITEIQSLSSTMFVFLSSENEVRDPSHFNVTNGNSNSYLSHSPTTLIFFSFSLGQESVQLTTQWA